MPNGLGGGLHTDIVQNEKTSLGTGNSEIYKYTITSHNFNLSLKAKSEVGKMQLSKNERK
jgi:hypothetical protein